jgi:hypothetical protein
VVVIRYHNGERSASVCILGRLILGVRENPEKIRRIHCHVGGASMVNF